MALDQALSNGSERERLARLVTQKLEHGTDAEVNGLLRQLTHSASGEQRRGDQLKRSDIVDPAKMKRTGEDDEDDDLRARLAARLRAQGKSEDEIKTVCDIALGPERSAMRGGVFGGGMGGNLREQISQPSVSPTDPAARDRNFPIAEEAAGQCAYAGDRGSRSFGGADSFEGLFARQDKVAQIREAQRPRPTARQLAADEVQREVGRHSFEAMFGPNAMRIRNYI
jgi:hypothetical protein